MNLNSTGCSIVPNDEEIELLLVTTFEKLVLASYAINSIRYDINENYSNPAMIKNIMLVKRIKKTFELWNMGRNNE